ncbi:MAG: extracellular solute-binding protein [Candidatus Sungbacteria bacterium]|nr:extracellular solute-binding protein [Candidatus Sungbacteria bacterium]
MSFSIKIGLYIAFGVLVILAILMALGVITPFKSAPTSGSLIIWDVGDRKRAFSALLEQYRGAFPNVKITYEAKDPGTYKEELLDALAAGQGPDIFVLQNDEILDQKNKLSPLPIGASQAKAFLEKMPDAVMGDLTDDENIYGVPLFVDTLALYYNKDHLNAANIPAAPTTWEEFQDQSKRLTRTLPGGEIIRSGASFGTAKNVEHAAEIFYALLLQTGNPIFTSRDAKFHLSDRAETSTGDEPAGVSALNFYTSFANPRSPFYTWNSTLPGSRGSFADGRAAFYIGYARDFNYILGKNPHLNFGVSRLPQLNADSRISYASYQFLTVAKNSQSPALAWTFLLAMAEPSMSDAISKALLLPPANRDLAVKGPSNKILKPFYDQVLSAKSWLIFSRGTVAAIFRDMLDSVAEKSVAPESALGRAQSQLSTLAQDRAQ